jgi:hypothetical protein
MMHAVIRSPNDTIHLIGHVDAYNVESLRDHVRGMGRHGHVSLSIEIDPADRPALERHAGRWLGRLAGSGARVAIRAGAQPVVLAAPERAA